MSFFRKKKATKNTVLGSSFAKRIGGHYFLDCKDGGKCEHYEGEAQCNCECGCCTSGSCTCTPPKNPNSQNQRSSTPPTPRLNRLEACEKALRLLQEENARLREENNRLKQKH